MRLLLTLLPNVRETTTKQDHKCVCLARSKRHKAIDWELLFEIPVSIWVRYLSVHHQNFVELATGGRLNLVDMFNFFDKQ